MSGLVKLCAVDSLSHFSKYSANVGMDTRILPSNWVSARFCGREHLSCYVIRPPAGLHRSELGKNGPPAITRLSQEGWSTSHIGLVTRNSRRKNTDRWGGRFKKFNGT